MSYHKQMVPEALGHGGERRDAINRVHITDMKSIQYNWSPQFGCGRDKSRPYRNPCPMDNYLHMAQKSQKGHLG